jgi:hypothetical protein
LAELEADPYHVLVISRDRFDELWNSGNEPMPHVSSIRRLLEDVPVYRGVGCNEIALL